MHKAFIFTLATFVMLSSLFLIISSFNVRQSEFIESMSSGTSGYRVTHIWSDVSESLQNITDFDIQVTGQRIDVSDKLPKVHDITTLLTNYGMFLENVYEPSNINIKFLSSTGAEILLSELPSYIRIDNMGIIYDYPDYGQSELILTVPMSNFTSINSVNLDIKITNKNITETAWAWAPLKSCSGSDCIKLIITARDNFMSHTYAETSFSRTQQSKAQVALSGAGWIDIIVGTQSGSTQNIYRVTMHNAQADSVTSLLLNTTEFSVQYPSKLSVTDLNYGISKEDWFK